MTSRNQKLIDKLKAQDKLIEAKYVGEDKMKAIKDLWSKYFSLARKKLRSSQKALKALEKLLLVEAADMVGEGLTRTQAKFQARESLLMSPEWKDYEEDMMLLTEITRLNREIIRKGAKEREERDYNIKNYHYA